MYTNNDLKEFMSKGNNDSYFAGERHLDKYLLYSVNRDSGIIDRSNFDVLLKQLEPYSEDYEIQRCSHWACGWVDYIWISENCSNEVAKIACEAVSSLSDYLILSESYYSNMQHHELNEYWDGLHLSDKIELAKKCEVSIFSVRHECFPDEIYDLLADTSNFL